MTGHVLAKLHPQPSGWFARCECGAEFRAPREHFVLDEWRAHRDDVVNADTEVVS